MIRAFSIALGLVAVISGCTASPASPTLEPSVASAAATRTPIPTESPLPGLPTEIVGSWETDLREFREDEDICFECGPKVTLIIRAHGSWTVSRAGGQASGAFSIRGGRIVFGPSTACDGTGSYEWQFDGDTLTLTAVEPDECVRRAEALDGPTYSRTE